MVDIFASALGYLGNPLYWIALGVAVLLSALVGLIPGMSALIVMTIAIPFIVFNISDPVIGLVLLASITGVSNTLDSIPAVLLGQPGAATQVTYLEGHQLARQGRAAHTLGAVYAVSAIGGVVGAICLALTIPIIRPFILSFSFGEIAAVGLFGLAMISALSRGAMVRGFAAAAFGLFVGTIGTAPVGGVDRFVFGQVQLWEGLPLIPVTMGLFALPEMVDLMMTRQAIAAKGATVSTKEVLRGAWYGTRQWKVAIRQSIFGVFMGAIPGVGGAVIDWLAYAFGILWAKDRQQFGKGSLDGVLFAESAQNAKEGGQAIPTLALGIPGGAVWALVIAAMLIYGISPGPEMLGRFAHVTMVLVFTLAIGNLAITILGLVGTAPLTRLTTIPYPIVGSCVIPISLLAAFLAMTDWTALPVAFAFTALGLLMKRFQWPRPPLLLGFILGPIIEKNLMDAIAVHGAIGMATRPVTIVLTVVAIAVSILFYYLIARSSKAVVLVGVPQGSADAESDASGTSVSQQQPRFTWRWDHVAPLVFIIVSLYFLLQSLGLPPRAQALPLWSCAAVIALSFVQLARQARPQHGKTADIMDLGIRSAGLVGARQAGLIVAGLFTVFVTVSLIAGLRYGAIAFAALGPLVLLQGRKRWLLAGLTGSIVALFALVVADMLIATIWPRPILWQWLRQVF